MDGLAVMLTVRPVAEHKRMEKKEEYGVPWLWKRVPVGTWVKGGILERSRRDSGSEENKSLRN